MLKEDPTPMTAYITGVETVRLGMEVDRDKGEDIKRNAVDVNEGVPPLADVCQRSRNIPVELRNVVNGEAVVEVSVSLGAIARGLASELVIIFHDVRRRIRRVLQLLVQSKNELRK